MNKNYQQSLLRTVYDAYDSYLSTKSDFLLRFNTEDVLAKFFSPGPSYHYILDSPTLTIEKASKEAQEMLGMDIEGQPLDTLIALVPEADIPFILNCENKVAHFIKNEILPEQILKYKFSYCVRERFADGKYRLCLVQNMALAIDSNGALLKVFGVHSDISALCEENSYQLSFHGFDGEPSYQYKMNHLLDKDNPTIPLVYIFTPREMEIIGYLSNGLGVKEIADKLFISTHTVESHKKNAIKKASCRNTTELIAYCIRYGLI